MPRKEIVGKLPIKSDVSYLEKRDYSLVRAGFCVFTP